MVEGDDASPEVSESLEEKATAPEAIPECLKLAWSWPENAFDIHKVGYEISIPPLIASVECDDASYFVNQTADCEDDLVKFILAPRRLARSTYHVKFNEAKIAVLDAEKAYGEVKGSTPKEEVLLKEEKMKEIEQRKIEADEAEKTMMEFNATLDESALAPWKCGLISVVEAGMTCIMTAPQVDSVGYPVDLFSKAKCDAFAESEKLLGVFSDTCIKEKGRSPIFIANICPSTYRGPTANYEELLDCAIERLRVDKIPAVLLHWYDFSEGGEASCIEAMISLTSLQKKDKIGLIGVSNFPSSIIQKILDAGIQLQLISAPYNLIDQRAALKTIPMCKEYGITFIANNATAYGFLSASDETKQAPPGSMQRPVLMTEYQELLTKLSGVAAENGVSVEVVSIRWILDQGLIPVVPIKYTSLQTSRSSAEESDSEVSTAAPAEGASSCWMGFGANGHLKSSPGFNLKLLKQESFLTKKNLEILTEAGMKVGHTGDTGEIESGNCGYRV